MDQERQGQLSRIAIKGFKSIKECDIELKNINVLIGSNGAGKSNFISAFEMLQKILEQELSLYVGKKGANSLLYNGSKFTDFIQMAFFFDANCYSFGLELSERNNLVFSFENFSEGIDDIQSFIGTTTGGHNESSMVQEPIYPIHDADDTLDVLKTKAWRVYHFHDTGATSKMKMEHNLSNSKMLNQDASNLAAFLYRLKKYHKPSYKQILNAVRLVAPYFRDFELEPMEYNRDLITLHWMQKGCDDIFNAFQLSDGTLRFICLAALLLQPTELQPATIIIDEPELGLHPFAVTIFAEMVQKAAVNKQIILSTQSVELLDHFEAEDVVVVDRDENGSAFKRLDITKLAIWLEDDYTLGDLWKKNILGGRFARWND